MTAGTKIIYGKARVPGEPIRLGPVTDTELTRIDEFYKPKVDIAKIIAMRRAGYNWQSIGDEVYLSGTNCANYYRRFADECQDKEVIK